MVEFASFLLICLITKHTLSILFRGPNSWAIGSRHSGVRLIIFKKFGQKKVGN